MKEYPFVSIIIPAKNEESNIALCLEGIQSLEYPRNKLEVIVVDNGSEDRTVNIAKSMGAMTFILPNVTIAALRNYGFYQSKGKFVAFIDADCIPNAQWLTIAVRIMLANKNIGVVGGILTLREGGSKYWIEEYWLHYLNSRYRHNKQYVNTFSSFCFVVRREKMEEVGGFNERLITCEDYDLGYRIFKTGCKIVINKKIKVVHLRNAKNAYEFFLRQAWQGRTNLINFLSHEFELKEFTSVIIPIGYLISIVCFPVTLLLKMAYPLKWVLAFISFCLPGIITIRTRIGRNKLRFWGYYYLWFLYLCARGIGVLFKVDHWKRKD